MKELQRINEALEKNGRAEALKSIADSDDGRAIGRMLDSSEVERAAKSGDAEALKGILSQVLCTPEGKRLAESLKNAMK